MGPSWVSYDVNGPLWGVSFYVMYNLLLRVCGAHFPRLWALCFLRGLTKYAIMYTKLKRGEQMISTPERDPEHMPAYTPRFTIKGITGTNVYSGSIVGKEQNPKL